MLPEAQTYNGVLVVLKICTYIKRLDETKWPETRNETPRPRPHHRLNGSSSPVLTATSLSYGKARNSTPTESKPLTRLR